MLKIRTILEFIKYVWQSKTKQYVICYLYSDKSKAGSLYKVEYYFDLRLAQKRAYELLTIGDAEAVKILMEISVIKSVVDIKNDKSR